MKPISLLYLTFLILIQFSCGNNIVSEPTPNSKEDYISINKEISQNKLDSVCGENYMYWLKNDEMVKLYVFDEYPEAAIFKEFYFKNNNIIAFQIQNVVLPISMNYKALLYISDGKILDEEFWIDDVKKNKNSFLEYLSAKQEMSGDNLSYEESILKESQTKNRITDLSINVLIETYNIDYNSNNKTNSNENSTLNKNTLSNIRSLVINGNKRNLIRRLGNPDELLSASDFLLKYFDVEASYNKIKYSDIYIYNEISDKPIVVILNNYNNKVFEVLYLDEINSIEDIYIDWLS